jgi:hypothetical protein
MEHQLNNNNNNKKLEHKINVNKKKINKQTIYLTNKTMTTTNIIIIIKR